jgi:cytoskeletal protein RodZ
MGQAQRGVPEAPSVGRDARAQSRGDADTGENIGAYLARQRELRGISLDQLSAATRIPRRSLERLEAGAHDADLDGFVRGFVRTVASALGLPPEETLARMLPEVAAPGRKRGGGLRALRRISLALGAVALVGVAWWLWEGRPATPSEAAAPALPPGVILRHDAVRELAAEVARSAPAPPAEALPPSGSTASPDDAPRPPSPGSGSPDAVQVPEPSDGRR